MNTSNRVEEKVYRCEMGGVDWDGSEVDCHEPALYQVYVGSAFFGSGASVVPQLACFDCAMSCRRDGMNVVAWPEAATRGDSK